MHQTDQGSDDHNDQNSHAHQKKSKRRRRVRRKAQREAITPDDVDFTNLSSDAVYAKVTKLSPDDIRANFFFILLYLRFIWSMIEAKVRSDLVKLKARICFTMILLFVLQVMAKTAKANDITVELPKNIKDLTENVGLVDAMLQLATSQIDQHDERLTLLMQRVVTIEEDCESALQNLFEKMFANEIFDIDDDDENVRA